MTDTTTNAGAMPVAGGATPSQTAATANVDTSATDDPELGEAGTRALAAERARANAAEKSAKALQSRLAELETAEEARKTANLSDAEKLSKRIADLERENADHLARAQESTVRMVVLDAAARLGFRSPELAYRALDRSGIEFKDDGTPRNVEKLLRELLEREPYLGKPTGAPDFGGGQRGQSASGQPSMNDIIRAAARGG